MGYLPFFPAKSGTDLVDLCLELAVYFKTDPWPFFDKPEYEVVQVYERVMARLRRIAIERGENPDDAG